MQRCELERTRCSWDAENLDAQGSQRAAQAGRGGSRGHTTGQRPGGTPLAPERHINVNLTCVRSHQTGQIPQTRASGAARGG